MLPVLSKPDHSLKMPANISKGVIFQMSHLITAHVQVKLAKFWWKRRVHQLPCSPPPPIVFAHQINPGHFQVKTHMDN